MLETLLISSAIGAGVSALEGLFGTDPADEMQKKLDKVLNQLDSMKITPAEEREKIDKVGDVFNTNMLNNLNDTTVGVSLSGVSNPEVIRADMTSKLLGERSKATLEEQRRIEELNNNIEMQKAQYEMGTPVSNKPSVFTDILQGGMAGAQIGLNVASLKEQSLYNKGMLEWLGKTTPPPTVQIENGVSDIIRTAFDNVNNGVWNPDIFPNKGN
jgi:hypothetical protein